LDCYFNNNSSSHGEIISQVIDFNSWKEIKSRIE
jgi:hypothetical protein